MKRELFAFMIIAVVLAGLPAALFGYQALRTQASDARVISLVGQAPAGGGWTPDTLRVKVGERVRLRIAAPDVVHGFEIPALGVRVDEILPGHVKEVEFTATQAGRYPFACTRWCSADHWRMRGVIEVVDPANPNPAQPTFAPPLFQQMQIDIDAPHPAQNVPTARPSAGRALALGLVLPRELQDPDYIRKHSPDELFVQVRREPSLSAYADNELWDAVALAYERAIGQEAIARGQKLYARDCAACHGERGQGNGPAGINLPGLSAMYPEGSQMLAHAAMKRGPADLTDASQMLGASDILLQGKILRGGMGTGMPEWGSLYTEADMWDVISYLRSLTFDYSK